MTFFCKGKGRKEFDILPAFFVRGAFSAPMRDYFSILHMTARQVNLPANLPNSRAGMSWE